MPRRCAPVLAKSSQRLGQIDAGAPAAALEAAHRHRPRHPENPPILIFDEATSALDSDSEHAITQELDRLSRNRTTLIIAHRLSTVVNAHAIVVMERGRIVETGSHAELLRQEGIYARLWLLQQRMDKDMA